MRQGPRTWVRGSRMWSGEAGGGPKREGQSTRDAGQGGVMMLWSGAELGSSWRTHLDHHCPAARVRMAAMKSAAV